MPIEEIVVRGKRIRFEPGSPGDFSRGPGVEGPRGERGSRERPQPPQVQPEEKTFVPPPLVQPIEEIIVTAKKPPKLGWRTIAGRGLAAASWILTGGFAIYELDRYRRQLEEEADEKSKQESEERRKRRLERETLQETIPEIVVVGKRPPKFRPLDFKPGPYVLPPLPQWFDRYTDPDPWIMQPFYPPTLPEPAAPAAPAAPTAPPQIPTAPPLRISPPIIRPGRTPTRPEIRPGTRPTVRPSTPTVPAPAPAPAPPATQPQPQVRPSVQPQPQVNPFTTTSPWVQPLVSPATRLQSRTLTRVRPTVRPSRQAQPLPIPGLGNLNCPPCTQKKCKKEEEKPRQECWRKLVKEGRYPADDTEYPWVPIDCDTGREIKGRTFWR